MSSMMGERIDERIEERIDERIDTAQRIGGSTFDRVPSRAEATAAFGVVRSYLESLDPRPRIRAAEGFRRQLDAIDARTLAAGVVGDPDAKGATRGAFRMAGEAGVSKTEQRRRVNRARAVSENPAIADRLADGTLSGDHVDAVARAARRTAGAAARDLGLLERLAGASADQAAGIADEWVDNRLTAEAVQGEHDRQRRLRSVRRGTTPDGLASITVAGDRASIDSAWRRIERAADELYRDDGGRELQAGHHERSSVQRLFDACLDLITGDNGDPRGTTSGAGCRPTIVITAALETMADAEGAAPARLVGTGPIAPTLLGYHRCNADLVGVVFGTDGQPLWFGRAVRTVTNAQWIALVARDGACVQCGADHTRCEAHHLIPWSAPAAGATDITNLALVCSSCHRQLHERLQTLVRGPGATWLTRPASAAETPPPGGCARPTRVAAHAVGSGAGPPG